MKLLRRTVANGCVSFTIMIIVYTFIGNTGVDIIFPTESVTDLNYAVVQFLTVVVKDFFITCFGASFAMSIFDYFDDYPFWLSSIIRMLIIETVVIGLGGFLLDMFPLDFRWVSTVSGMVVLAYFTVYLVLYLQNKTEEAKINQVLLTRKERKK